MFLNKIAEELELFFLRYRSFPRPEWNEEVHCQYFYIFPTRHIHESGYRTVRIVAKTETEYLDVTSWCDVIHMGSLLTPEQSKMFGFHINIDVDRYGNIRIFNLHPEVLEFVFSAPLSSQMIALKYKPKRIESND